MNEIDCCWLCWESLQKNEQRKNTEPEVDICSSPARTYLEICIKYLNLESGNLEEISDEFKTCPLCSNCLHSAKKLTEIVDELEKIKKELDSHCLTFLERLKRDREKIRRKNMKQIRTYVKRCKNAKPTGEESAPEDNAQFDVQLESEEITLDKDDIGLKNIEQLNEDTGSCDLENEDDSSIMIDDGQGSNNSKNSQTRVIRISRQKSSKRSRTIKGDLVAKNIPCSKCDATFQTKARLSEHNRKVHAKQRGKSNYICETCGKVFRMNVMLRHHVARYHQTERPYKCSLCPKSFILSYELKRHEASHQSEPTHLCNFCGKGFFWVTQLNTHIKRCHSKPESANDEESRKEYHCEECGKIIKGGRYKFETHKRIHTGEKPHKCPDCDEHFRIKPDLRCHRQKMHADEFPYQCKKCEMKFKVRYQLSNHLARVHKPTHEPIICDDCGKSFKSQNGYKRHRSSIHDNIRYKCDHCDKMFSTAGECKLHVKVAHTKEIQHVCHFCGKESSCKTKLLDHIRTHTGEKLYQCKECGKYFTSNSALSWHRAANHRQKKKA